MFARKKTTAVVAVGAAWLVAMAACGDEASVATDDDAGSGATGPGGAGGSGGSPATTTSSAVTSGTANGGAGGDGTGGMGTCTFAGFDQACNDCVDTACSAEKQACCNAPGCVGLIDCAATNCGDTSDLTCILSNCGAELAAAGGPGGLGTTAAQNVATCAAPACPACTDGAGGAGGMGAGGGGAGGMGGGGTGGGAPSCSFSSFDASCNTCVDNACPSEAQACCATAGCVDLVNCAVTSCPTDPTDPVCVSSMCSNELAAAGGLSGPGTQAALSLANCAEPACPNCF
jgi:hypothetical protein